MTLSLSTGQPKQLSKKMIVLQLTGVFLLVLFLMSTLGLDNYIQDNASDVCVDISGYCASADDVLEPILHEYKEVQVEPQEVATTPLTKPKEFPYTIVTGASANHLCALENFIYSLNARRPELKPEEFPRIVVYNIGLNRTQLPVLDQLVRHGLIDEVVTFDYFKYPRFWDVAINAGEYAWKTGIIHEATATYGGILVWLDAGNMVSANFLRNIPGLVQRQGFWSPRSSYVMSRWTHPGMFAYFNENPKDYADFPNCNGAAIGFDTNNKTIVDTIINGWYECALDKRCIAPPGSSRLNHRQDQAVLTYLAYRYGHKCTMNPSRYDNLQIHRDKSCNTGLLELELQDLLYHPSSIDFPKWQRSDTLALYNHPEWRYPEDAVPQHIAQLLQPPKPL